MATKKELPNEYKLQLNHDDIDELVSGFMPTFETPFGTIILYLYEEEDLV